MSIVLPNAMVDYYEVIDILDSCEELSDELRDLLVQRIDKQPWYEGFHVDEDDCISNVFLMEEHHK